jgi:hypothetical protein
VSWRDQYIASTAEALNFLKDQVCAVTGASPEECQFTHPDNKKIVYKTGVDFNLEYQGLSILGFKIERNSPFDFKLPYVRVNESHKGNGLGSTAVKAALGIAHEAGAEAIRIILINQNGPGFWPSLGAVPITKPIRLAGILDDALTRYKHDIADVHKPKLNKIRNIAHEAPYLGWLLLSQTNVVLLHAGNTLLQNGKQSRAYFAQHVFESLHNDEMVLLPGVPIIRTILEKKLGILPPFRPPGPKSEYRHIVAKLGQKPTSAWTFDI